MVAHLPRGTGQLSPLEEGSADVFTDVALRRMTGFDASKTGLRRYSEQAQAVEALLEAGFPPPLVEQVLEYRRGLAGAHPAAAGLPEEPTVIYLGLKS
ncbi:MAG: hypothetical protein C4331_18230, partial [Meiothermus sp.]